MTDINVEVFLNMRVFTVYFIYEAVHVVFLCGVADAVSSDSWSVEQITLTAGTGH